MWHEARKQEKKIRSMMVDYHKRADRRRQFYEKIKMDPTQFIRVYGRQNKVHLEPSVALAAEGPQSMVAWTGDRNTMIDRFDVRAHLDYIPEPSHDEPELNSDEEQEELQCNYERYRILVQNDCAGVTEDQCLHQLYIDEQFGGMEAKLKEKEKEEEKKKKAMTKAAIGFSYDGSNKEEVGGGDGGKDEAEEEEEESDEEVDLDLVFDIDNLNEEQMVSLNKCSVQFGMRGDLYIEHLYKEREEVEMLKQARLEEDEKAQFSGRKSRRERRAFKEKKLRGKGNSPPSYALAQTKLSLLRGSSSSRSRSKSPVGGQGRTTYITSFGGNSDEEGGAPVKAQIQGPQLPPPEYLAKKTSTSSKSTEKARSSKSRSRSRRRSSSRSRSRADNRDRRRSSPARDRDRSRRSRSRSSRSRSRSRQTSGRFDRHGRYPAARRRSSDRDRQRSRRSRSRDRRSRSRSRDRRSRSRGRRSRSRSRDRGSRRSRSRDRRRSPARSSTSNNSKKIAARSKSRSPLLVREAGAVRAPSPPPLKRYRRESVSSGNDLSDDSDTESKSSSTLPQKDRRSDGLLSSGAVGSKEGGSAGKAGKVSAAEKLKRRLQLQLNKNFKADKKAQKEKVEKAEQERMEREEDIRMMALEMRRRAREKRVDDSDDDSPCRRRSRSASRSDDSGDAHADRSPRDIKPLLSLKLDARDRGNGRGGDDRSEERRRPPRQYDDDRLRRQNDNILRDSDYSRRRDDEGRSSNDRGSSRSYDRKDRHRSDDSSRGGLVDY